MMLQLLLIILKILGVIPQPLETFLSICTFFVLIVLTIAQCLQVIRRENDAIRRFNTMQYGEDILDRGRVRMSTRAGTETAVRGGLQEIRVHQITHQLRSINQLISQMNTQIRTNRYMMAVQYMSQNGNGQPILLPPADEMATLGQLILSQNFLNFLTNLSSNIENGQQTQGLTEEQINQFPIGLYSAAVEQAENIDACTICLEDFKEGTEIRSLLCNHIFHQTCIDEWLKLRNNCPNCKRVFEFPGEGQAPHMHNEALD